RIMIKDSRRNFGMGITIFVAIICLVSRLVLLSHLNKVGIVFAQSDSNASKFKAIRDQYLQSWENFGFQSIFDTYVVGDTNRGYGIYEEHVSNLSSVSNTSSVPSGSNMSNVSSANTFAPGETMYLYVEPVGFIHNPSSNESANTRYTIDISADIIISAPNGTELASIIDLPVIKVTSHQKNTELSLLLTLTQIKPFPIGDYNIKYVVKDKPSGRTFDITKEITITK
ncbi:MAG: hypothetical protein WBP96_11465, partial [Nitrososphaeraceae archaeon]